MSDNVKYKYVLKTREELVKVLHNTSFKQEISLFGDKWLKVLDNIDMYGKEITEHLKDSIKMEFLGSDYHLRIDMYNTTPIEGKTKFFIKTEKEFELEFGLNWISNLDKKWLPSYDDLFGLELKIDELDINNQYRIPNYRYVFLSDDMIKIVKTDKIENMSGSFKTKVELKTVNSFGGNQAYFYIWFLGRLGNDEITKKLNSDYIKKDFKTLSGSVDVTWKIIQTKWTVEIPTYDLFDKLYIDSSISHSDTDKQNLKLPIIPNKKTTDVDIKLLTDDELLNLRDRIDELLFKRQYKLSDDEYTYYLENETLIKPEEVKIYFSDKFKLKKMNIRRILKEKGMVN